MTDEVIKLSIVKSDEKNATHYIENVDVLVLRAKDVSTKHGISLADAVRILEHQKSIAIGRLIGEGIVIFNEEFSKSVKSKESKKATLDKIKEYLGKILEYMKSGKLNPRSDMRIDEDKKSFKELQRIHGLQQTD